MKRIHRIVVLASVALAIGALAAPAVAADDVADTSGDATETTVAPETISSGEEPAVVVPPAEVKVPEQPWTARFLIPLFVVSALAIIIGVVIAYNRSVRHRYKVVA
jgi:hypothetical protein